MRCDGLGNGAAVTALDWAEGGASIRGATSSQQVLHMDAASGVRLPTCMTDEDIWATGTVGVGVQVCASDMALAQPNPNAVQLHGLFVRTQSPPAWARPAGQRPGLGLGFGAGRAGGVPPPRAIGRHLSTRACISLPAGVHSRTRSQRIAQVSVLSSKMCQGNETSVSAQPTASSY